MKKSLIYTSVCGLALFTGSLTTVAINNASAETSHDSPTVALEQSLNTSNKIDSKNETVYVMTNSEGKANSVFINNTLDSDATSLPLELKVTYTLDGSEISAEDLIGKSGHVKINYAFASTETSGNTKVPFLTVTSTILDGDKFKNVTINNGKVISENDDNVTLAGYAVVGLNENLGTDVLPADFTVEADVTEFEMSETYSLATDELFADFDTSKLNSLDDLINSMNQLGSGLDQLIAGAGSLSSGLDSAVSGVAQLQSGAGKLNSGAGELATGISTLETKVNDQLVPKLSKLQDALYKVSEKGATVKTYVNDSSAKIIDALKVVKEKDQIKDNPEIQAYLNQAISKLSEGSTLINEKIDYYTGAINAEADGMDTTELTEGIAALSAGANQLYAGTSELKTGLDTLASGTTQLADGSKTLENGLNTFKSSGIDKLVNFANNDLNNALANVRTSVSAAKDYHSYKNSSAESVKFVFKTPSLKK